MTTETQLKSAQTSASAMAQALKTIGFNSDELTKAAEVLADSEILKSVSSLSAQELSRPELVPDRWTEGRTHSVPTREEIRTGPPQASSGGGAERMVAEYSRPAPQDALTMQAERLADMLGSMRAYMRSTNDSLASLAKHQEAYTTILTALAGSVAGAKSEFNATDELTSFAKQCSAKSQKYFDAARTALSEAVTLREDIGELAAEAKKVRKSEISSLRDTAAGFVVKSYDAALAACSGGEDTTAELRKSIVTLLDSDPSFKSKMESMRDKMREKDEKDCSKKAMKKSLKKLVRKAAAKMAAKAASKAAVKNNQADEQDKENKNQDDKSVSTKAEIDAETQALIQKTLDGQAMLQGTVADLMSVLNGRKVTTGASTPLMLVKSGDNTVDTLDQFGRIEKAISERLLSDAEAMRARDFAAKYTAVELGQISKSMWASLVAKSSRVVQDLFPEATAA